MIPEPGLFITVRCDACHRIIPTNIEPVYLVGRHGVPMQTCPACAERERVNFRANNLANDQRKLFP